MTSGREDEIRRRAHEIWEQEGRPSGRDRQHWERAERELADMPPDTPAGKPAARPAKAAAGKAPAASLPKPARAAPRKPAAPK